MKNIKHLLNVSWIRLGENSNFRKREYYFVRAPTETESRKGVNEIHSYSMITPGISMEEMPEFQEVYENVSTEEEGEKESNNLIDLKSYLSGNYNYI